MDLSSSIQYFYKGFWREMSHPVSVQYPLFSDGPTEVLSIIGLYLLFVLVLGPKWMKNRPPFVLKGPIVIYNLTLVVLNFYFFLMTAYYINYGRVFLDFKFPNNTQIPKEFHEEFFFLYLCFLSKFADLLDTIFFVLRKKDRQISFLHLYHHSSVPIFGWIVGKVVPQAPVLKLFLLLNCFVHTIMYLYYGLAAIGPHMQKYLWWKKYITQLQMIQFVILIIYSTFMAFLQEGYPSVLFWFGFTQLPLFLYLFYSFYRSAYNRSKNIKTTNGIDKKD